MTREEAKELTQEGWHQYVDMAYDVVLRLGVHAEVEDVAVRKGTLFLYLTPVDDPVAAFVLYSVTNMISRQSVLTCHVCGEHGRRRDDLPELLPYCIPCFAFAFSDFYPEPLITNTTPQHDF